MFVSTGRSIGFRYPLSIRIFLCRNADESMCSPYTNEFTVRIKQELLQCLRNKIQFLTLQTMVIPNLSVTRFSNLFLPSFLPPSASILPPPYCSAPSCPHTCVHHLSHSCIALKPTLPLVYLSSMNL